MTTEHHPLCDDDGWDHSGPCVLETDEPPRMEAPPATTTYFDVQYQIGFTLRIAVSDGEAQLVHQQTEHLEPMYPYRAYVVDPTHEAEEDPEFVRYCDWEDAGDRIALDFVRAQDYVASLTPQGGE